MVKIYGLTEDQTMVKELAEQLAESEIQMRAQEVDHLEKYPEEGMGYLAEAGLIGCMIPEEFEGLGLDRVSQTLAIKEVAKQCASTAWCMTSSAITAECILAAGSEMVKNTVLPEIISGVPTSVVSGYQNIKAEKISDGYILDGTVNHLLNVGAKWYLVPAVYETKKKWFLLSENDVERCLKSNEKLLGLKGCPSGSIALKSCKIEEQYALSEVAEAAFTEAAAIYTAAISAGIAEGALQEAITYVNQRVQFNKTIAQFENTQQVMSMLLAKSQAANSLVRDAARVKDAGDDAAVMGALARIAAADTASEVTRKCIQFMGGYGYSREYPVERKMRDAKMIELIGKAQYEYKELVARQMIIQ